MSNHDFTLRVEGVPGITQAIVDALFEAGCDDCTFFMSNGRFYATYSRVAPTLAGAISSAIADVLGADVGATAFTVVEEDWCGIGSDIKRPSSLWD